MIEVFFSQLSILSIVFLLLKLLLQVQGELDIVYVIVNYTWLEFERRDINKLITSRVNKEKLIRNLFFQGWHLCIT